MKFLIIFLMCAVMAQSLWLDKLKQDDEEIARERANDACKKENCLPLVPNVCPLMFICNNYCVKYQNATVGLCGDDGCGCVNI